MKTKYIFFLFVIILLSNCQNPGLYLGEDSEDISTVYDYDIPHIICRYIGVFHEHPSNSTELLAHLKEDMQMEGFDSLIFERYSEFFSSRKNEYKKNSTRIYDPRNRRFCTVVGDLDSWQKDSWGLFFVYGKALFLDKDNVIRWGDTGCDAPVFGPLYTELYRDKSKVLFLNIKPSMGSSQYVSFWVRVTYNRENGVSIHRMDELQNLYTKHDGVFSKLEISRSSLDSLYDVYEKRLEYLFPKVMGVDSLDSVDVYLPLLLP